MIGSEAKFHTLLRHPIALHSQRSAAKGTCSAPHMPRQRPSMKKHRMSIKCELYLTTSLHLTLPQLLSKIRVTAGFSADELADKEGDLASEAQKKPKADEVLLREAESAEATQVPCTATCWNICIFACCPASMICSRQVDVLYCRRH